MQAKDYTKTYEQLIRTRSKILFPLIFLTVSSYFSFIGVIAFNPKFFGALIVGTKISIGILLGFFLILLIFLITFTYVYLANKKIEPLIKQIQKNV
jgi:uncharacterized membrane protein (DUF485 family)|tara:strand:+ start:958 stop:1245 length:288 start_codon:yes stop_codon:yes gene_type:complete